MVAFNDHQISVEYLRSRLLYNPLTGIFTWRPITANDKHQQRWNLRFAFKEAGGNRHGYISISIDKIPYYAHRLAWLYVYGQASQSMIDHQDCCPSNNIISNLREASSADNNRNTPCRKTSSSGVKNVSWDTKRSKWAVYVSFEGISKFFGRFDDIEDAKIAATLGRQQLHGEFARDS